MVRGTAACLASGSFLTPCSRLETAGVEIHAGGKTAAQRLDRERQGTNSLKSAHQGHIDSWEILMSEAGRCNLKAPRQHIKPEAS